MQITIEVKYENSIHNVYYKGVNLGALVFTLRHHFKLQHGNSYIVTITEGGKFRLKMSTYGDYYHFYKKTRFLYFFPGFEDYAGLVCIKQFDRLFFVPDVKKDYDITVKKVG